MDFATIISEDRIKKAYEDGEFKDLPGFGKPLKLDDLSGVPEELRMAYRMLKNAGFSPEDNVLKQEMLSIEDLLKNCEDDAERKTLQAKLNEKQLRFNQVMSKRRGTGNSSIFKNYEQKIDRKFY